MVNMEPNDGHNEGLYFQNQVTFFDFWSSYMFEKLLKMLWVLNNQGFWIWHGCVFKRYAEFRMSYYGSTCLNNAYVYLNMSKCPSVCLSMAEYCWIFLNIPENPWINCSDYARVLNMPQYSYNNIIIVTNVIMLEFLSARFTHPGALLPLYLF